MALHARSAAAGRRLLRLPTLTRRTSLPLLPPLLQLAVLLQLLCVASALNQDGVLLLSFKLSLAADPLGSLSGWGYADATPCSWNGVVCSSDERVAGVVLPNVQLVGPIAGQLGFIEHLRHLDLSGNALNGSIPADLFRAAELRVLSLAGNGLTGGLPEQVGQLRSLRALNLAGNALSGAVPRNLTLLTNLTAVSLANNFFSGAVPDGGFAAALEILDVSANLLNGSLPTDFGGAALRYVNLSSNRIAGAVPGEWATRLPANVTIDLSYNNLTGAIPDVPPFSAQRAAAFEGNAGLCGKPLDSLCSSSISSGAAAAEPRNATAVSKSPPAIAAIPEDTTTATEATLPGDAPPASGGEGKMRLGTIVAIAAGDVAGIAILSLVFLYVYQLRKRRQRQEAAKQRTVGVVFKKPTAEPEESSPDTCGRSLSCCLRKKAGEESDDTDQDVTDTSPSFAAKDNATMDRNVVAAAGQKKKGGSINGVLVTVDGGAALELETLLKASAYILGSAGGSIVYKAVLADGSALAVRRIGSDDAGVRRFGDLDAHMRAVARLRHGNVLRLRGFYWGPEEVLVIHEFAVNGSLANLSVRRKPGSFPVNLGWSARLRIARGVARGLAFLHDRRWVHGNVKPSNVLLDADMEPLLADLGVDRLVRTSHHGSTTTAAGRFGSKRSAKSLPDMSPPPASPMAGGGGGAPSETATHYRAPEAVASASRSTKPSAKWDVYSFGVLLLELVAGRALTSVELCRCGAGAEEKAQQELLRLADPALRAETEGREEAVASCLRLGAACCAMAPNKRPSMRDALQAIDRIPALASASSSTTATTGGER